MSRIVQPTAAWPQTFGPDPAQFIAAGLAGMPMAQGQGAPFPFRSLSQRDPQTSAPKVVPPVHVVVRSQSSPQGLLQPAPRQSSPVPPLGAVATMNRTGSQSIPYKALSPGPQAKVKLEARVVSGGMPYGPPSTAQMRGRSPAMQVAEAPIRRQEVTFLIQEPLLTQAEPLSPVCSISTLQSFCIDETKVLDLTQVIEPADVPHAVPEAGTREALIAELALKLEEMDTTSTEDLQRVVMDSLLSHGFKATAAILKTECDSDVFKTIRPKRLVVLSAYLSH